MKKKTKIKKLDNKLLVKLNHLVVPASSPKHFSNHISNNITNTKNFINIHIFHKVYLKFYIP